MEVVLIHGQKKKYWYFCNKQIRNLTYLPQSLCKQAIGEALFASE